MTKPLSRVESKTKKQIEALQKKINPLQQEINDLQEKEILEMQMPRIRKMVGYCLRGTYGEEYYAKILDLIEEDGYGQPEFILEEVHITKQGNPYIHLNNQSPYLNKEWWDSEVPMSGWERCSEEEYQTFKAKVMSELTTQKLLRKFIKKKR